MSIDAMKQALEALEMLAKWEHPASNITTKTGRVYPHRVAADAANNLRLAIEQAEKQEPVAWVGLTDEEYTHIRYGDDENGESYVDYELFDEGEYGFEVNIYVDSFARAIENKLRKKNTAPPQRQPLTDSVREMRDVQGRDGTWNYDPYMHGLYNGLEFAVSLLEQREPQFKDAPEKWLCDLPKPRIFSDAHGIGGEA